MRYGSDQTQIAFEVRARIPLRLCRFVEVGIREQPQPDDAAGIAVQ